MDAARKPTTLITGGTVVTMNAASETLRADVLIKGDRIAAIGQNLPKADRTLDATGCVLLPGFVQTHIHLCQTLFRNQADDLSLFKWLEKRIWPLEAAHDEASMRASAKLGIAELLKGGTTCILDMGTLRHTEVLFAAAKEMGIRALIGKAMMDAHTVRNPYLSETLDQSLAETQHLLEEWNGAENGRLSYAVAPRFAVSCSPDLLEAAVQLAREHNVPVHTHASENRDEVKLVRERTGMDNVEYLHSMAITGPDVCLAHCIWISEREEQILADTGTNVLHCPSANLKLGSGIAPIPELLDRGVRVTLGADGAACNNNLSVFQEMRTAALIQKPRLGPDVMNAETMLHMATIEGARALGLGNEIGSVEVGKKADLVLLSTDGIQQVPQGSVYSQIVYASSAADVDTVLVDGRILVHSRHLVDWDETRIVREAQEQAEVVLRRAQV